MKKILFLMLVPFILFGQTLTLTQYDRGVDKEFYFYAASLDSGIYNSASFELNQFDDDFANYPIGYQLELDTLAANDEIVGIYIQGNSQVDTWVDVDTLLAADTLNASHSGLAPYGVIDFAGATYMFPKYRIQVEATHANTGNTFKVALSLYAYKRD